MTDAEAAKAGLEKVTDFLEEALRDSPQPVASAAEINLTKA